MRKRKYSILSYAISAIILLSSFSFGAISVDAASNTTLPTAATTERVKTEILTAEITKLDDILQVIEYYMDADLMTAGISTSVNSDGRFQIMQTLRKNDTKFLTAMCESGLEASVAESDYAISVLLVLDAEGKEVRASDYEQSSGGLSEYSVYAVHTAYYASRETSFLDPIEVRTTQLVTKFTYGTAIKASTLVHKYTGTQSGLGDDTDVRTYPTITPSSAGVAYTNTVNGYWYKVGSGYAPHLDSSAIITVGNKIFTLSTRRNL